jgi:hypothetical protein
MRKISRAQEQESELNFRTATEKEAVNLNVVHDVVSMAPHAWNALKDVGHGVANAFDNVRHFVSEIGHADKYMNPFAGPHDSGNYNYQFHNYLKNQLPDITKHMSDQQIYNIADQWRVHGADALKHIPGLDSSKIDAINRGLSTTKYNMDLKENYELPEGIGALALTGGVPLGVGVGVKKLKEKLDERKDQRGQNSSGSGYDFFSTSPGGVGADWFGSPSQKGRSRGRRSSVTFEEPYNFDKTAVNLNIVHDVATMLPHIQHGIGQAAEAVGHGIGKVVDWATNTVTKPLHDPSTYGHDVKNEADVYAMQRGHFLPSGGIPNPTPSDIGAGQFTTDTRDLMHGINAIGVGGAGVAGIAKGVGMAVNKAIDTFGDRRQQKDRDKFMRRHPIIDKFSSFDERYAFEKTADAGILHPIMHGLSLLGTGVGDAVKSLAEQMVHPITHHFTGDPNVLHHLMDQADAAGKAHDAVGNEEALRAWQQYGDANTSLSFHPYGLGADGIAALTFLHGLNKMRKQNAERRNQ